MRFRRAPIDSLTVDGLTFAIRWSARRATVGITVARDGDLRVAAPRGTSPARVEKAIRTKLPWVRRKLAEFAEMGPPAEPRRLVPGERLPYLGRTYRLTLADAGGQPVRLTRGRFEMSHHLDGAAREAMLAWYARRARLRIGQRVAHFAPLLNVVPSAVVVRDLGRRRWGVCHTGTRVVSFHWELVLQPMRILDYVVVHELAHLLEPNHGPSFWRHVEEVLPDCKARRRWLSLHGQRRVF